jgi:hypothetical protein
MIVEYTCAACKGVFGEEEYPGKEEQRVAELEQNFGKVPISQCDRVCDNCYKEIMGWIMTPGKES